MSEAVPGAGSPGTLLSSGLSSGEGLEITWSQDVRLEDVLAAAARRARYLAGEDLPARGDGDGDSVGGSGGGGKRKRPRRRGHSSSAAAAGALAGNAQAGGAAADCPAVRDAEASSGRQGAAAVAVDAVAEDPLGEEAVEAALSGAGRTASLADLAGHAIVEPGPGLAGWLSSGATATMDDAALVNSIVSWRKLTSWAQSRELRAVAELAARRGAAGNEVPEDPVKKLEASFASSEVALALTLTPASADFWMDLALGLTGRLPDTLSALGSGRIDLAKARLIDMFTAGLDEELARAVERKVLEKAAQQTTGQLRAALQHAVIAVDPAAAERRRKEAEKNARVELFGDPDGTGSLAGRNLPAAQAAAAWARIGALAKALQSSGASGGLDLLRAQVFVGLLLGTLPVIPPAPPDGPADTGPEGSCPGPPGPGGSGPGGPGGRGDPESSNPQGPDALGPEEPDGTGPEDRGCAGRNGVGHVDPDIPGGPGPASGVPVDGGQGGRVTDSRAGRRSPGDSQPGGLDTPPDRGGWPSAAAPPWPGIPPPGAVPAPGCAAYWPAGTQPPRSSSYSGAGSPGGPDTELLMKAAMAAQVRLTVPLRTLAGLAAEPGQLSRIGPVTADVARGLAEAAATNEFCEWRIILTDADGRAIGVTRPSLRRAGAGTAEGPAPGWVTRIVVTVPVQALADRAIRDYCQPASSGRLGVVLAAALAAADRDAGRAGAGAGAGDDALAIGGCRHKAAVSGYRVPGSMRQFIEARDQTCGFPSCRQPSWRTDMDHTIPYHLGGQTCPCNISGECRHHHRMKQLPGWRLSQPRPGVLIWRTPARLTYTVTPDPYQI